jgi:hypothetical protein
VIQDGDPAIEVAELSLAIHACQFSHIFSSFVVRPYRVGCPQLPARRSPSKNL